VREIYRNMKITVVKLRQIIKEELGRMAYLGPSISAGSVYQNRKDGVEIEVEDVDQEGGYATYVVRYGDGTEERFEDDDLDALEKTLLGGFFPVTGRGY